MASLFEVADHDVRQLGRDDEPAILQLFEACTEFFRLVRMEPAAEAEQIFDDVPPSKRPEDKLLYGIYAGSSDDRLLIGLVELLRGYPAQDDWCLGLLLILPARRREGLGAVIVAAVVRFVSASGGRAIHLVVQEQNPGALHFWQRHGFVVKDTVLQPTMYGTNQVARLVLTW